MNLHRTTLLLQGLALVACGDVIVQPVSERPTRGLSTGSPDILFHEPPACDLDGLREDAETCDGSDLAGTTCADILGPSSTGTLACTQRCGWDTRGCSLPDPQDAMAGLAQDAPWPMHRHDPARSGRSPHLGPASPQIRWQLTTPYASPPTRDDTPMVPLLASGGLVLASAAERTRLHALAEGAVLWAGEDLPLYARPGPAAVTASALAFAVNDHALFGNDLQGQPLALPGPTYFDPAPFPSPAASSVAVAPDGTLYATHQHRLVARRPDGSIRWALGNKNVEALGQDTNPTALGYALGGTVALGLDGSLRVKGFSFDQTALVAVDPDGGVRWIRPIDCPYDAYGMAHELSLGTDGTTFITCDGGLYAIDASGELRWQHHQEQRFRGVALGADGATYLGADGQLLRLDAQGKPSWSLATGNWKADELQGSAPVVDAAGKIYLGTADGRLLVASAEGELLAEVALGTDPVTMLALGDDATLAAVAGDRILLLEEAP
ncbi:MAG: PQQ-binding-like beta-propeller repeat protein [Myxococcales bacterium]|nr:PQQ-binding-like beta-propeller repeat protein [Myxococcales bacterium]